MAGLPVVLLVLVTLATTGQLAWTAILNTTELIAREGYPWQTHVVESGGGYQLNLVRIPGHGTPVFLMHGVFVSSDAWVLRGKDKDLAFLLSDLGYDIWMGDARGNYYSRSHTTISPDDFKFWDFSVDEMGSQDLPALIDYVLDTTGHTSLVYVGHSMGTMMMYVMSALRPEYVPKVRLMVGMSPAAYVENTRAVMLKLLVHSSAMFESHFRRAGVHEVFPRNAAIGDFASKVCSNGSPTQPLCLRFAYDASGLSSPPDFSNVNRTLLPDFISHLFCGTSQKTLAHLSQLIKSDQFHRYDYGPEGNLHRYNSSSPPVYDLSKMTMPVLNFYGLADSIIHYEDIIRLSNQLPNLLDNVEVANPLFNHLDFTWAEDAKPLVYERTIATIANFV